MRQSCAEWTLFLVLSGCADAVTPAFDEATAAQPIGQGAECGPHQFSETGAVLGKVSWVTDSVCTGTLIASDVVLTAAHCVDPNVPQTFVPEPHALRGGGHLAIPVVRSVVHPLYHKPLLEGGAPRDAREEAALATLRSTCGMQNERLTDAAWRSCLLTQLPEDTMRTLGLVFDLNEHHDLALLYLRVPIAGASVAALPSFDINLAAGMPLDIVGYGVHGNAGLFSPNKGARYWGPTVVQTMGDGAFMTEGPAFTCGGDSGAPAFLPGLQAGVRRLVGVASKAYYDAHGECAGTSVFQRVDTNLDFVEQGLGGRTMVNVATVSKLIGAIEPSSRRSLMASRAPGAIVSSQEVRL